ncbi:MAG TPA: hypothetical protein DGT23_08290 [Micromonosporaceae bacterium]|nr:hypothetical protein [Micromonosporaceae bacterium]
MTMGEMAGRLDIAAGDVAEMKAALALREELAARGRGPAVTLTARLNASWSQQQEQLQRLAVELGELGVSVRLAASRYAATDEVL